MLFGRRKPGYTTTVDSSVDPEQAVLDLQKAELAAKKKPKAEVFDIDAASETARRLKETGSTFDGSAAKAGVALQRSAGRGALSDTAYLQLEGMGIPCLDLGCPDRYSHSPMECLSLADHEATGKLLCAFIDTLDAGFSTARY